MTNRHDDRCQICPFPAGPIPTLPLPKALQTRASCALIIHVVNIELYSTLDEENVYVQAWQPAAQHIIQWA